ncbi:helix-turn-helix domain-containing protein [Nonomuraea sp. NPDC049750]|uniref:helix-turn-helix domain-containing protein n=1 Tax=Nonomuraea sp. NPDC049750 TaxID=3154738 RepID=UPI0033FA35BB
MWSLDRAVASLVRCAIRGLTLDDLDLANRRIALAGRRQRLGDLSHRALRHWLRHRRATWPHTSNPHVLISDKTAHGTSPISQQFVTLRMNHTGCSVDRIRKEGWDGKRKYTVQQIADRLGIGRATIYRNLHV